jgi:hypothetical protein
MSWDTSSSTTYYNACGYGAKSEPESKPRPKGTFYSKAMEQLVKAGVLKGAVVIFSDRRLPVFKDRDELRNRGIITYYTDAITPGYDAPPSLGSYGAAVIIDALEYIPEMMARANLIKEALATLSLTHDNGAHVTMIVKTPEMVAKFAKEYKYEKTDSGFLIPDDHELGGLYMNGIDAEELIITANFAGAHISEIHSDVETDMACVRAYPKSKQSKKQKKKQSVGG